MRALHICVLCGDAFLNFETQKASRKSEMPLLEMHDNIRYGYYFFPGIASFAALATRNFTTFLAGILIASPVWGFLPMRALRFTRTSLPRPGSVKAFFASLYASAAMSSRICTANFFLMLAFFAMWSAI